MFNRGKIRLDKWLMGMVRLNHKTINARKDNTMSQSKYQKMNPVQIINDLDIFNKAVQYHYDIEDEALNTDDVYNGKILDFIVGELAENDDAENEDRYYEKIANDIMNEIADDLVAEICDRDRDAMEYDNERREARKGNY